MTKHLLHLLDQANRRQLDTDTLLSVQGACGVTIMLSATLAFLLAIQTNQSFSLAFAFELVLADLMLLGTVFLVLLAVCYGRYRYERTFWDYILSRRRIPLSHWTIPIRQNPAGMLPATHACWRLMRPGNRHSPHHRPKHKAPILLFQQATLLLAP